MIRKIHTLLQTLLTFLLPVRSAIVREGKYMLILENVLIFCLCILIFLARYMHCILASVELKRIGDKQHGKSQLYKHKLFSRSS